MNYFICKKNGFSMKKCEVGKKIFKKYTFFSTLFVKKHVITNKYEKSFYSCCGKFHFKHKAKNRI